MADVILFIQTDEDDTYKKHIMPTLIYRCGNCEREYSVKAWIEALGIPEILWRCVCGTLNDIMAAQVKEEHNG